MTIPTEVSRNGYIGNDVASVFAYSYRIIAASDLLVKVRAPAVGSAEITLALTTDYLVSNVGEDTGSIELVNGSQSWVTAGGALKQDYVLTIRRVRPLKQETDFRNQGEFFPEGHEDSADHGVMLVQQLKDAIDRSLKMKETEAGTAALTELPVDRASKVLGFDANKNPVAVSTVPTSGVTASAFMETLLDDPDAETARATLGAQAELRQTLTNGEASAIVIGQAVHVSSAGTVQKARANSSTTENAIGLVGDTSIAASASGKIHVLGHITASTTQWDLVTGQVGGLTAGSDYYLSAAVKGRITPTPPSGAGEFVRRVGHALSTTTLVIEIQPSIKL